MEEIDLLEYFKYVLKHLIYVILVPIILVFGVTLYDTLIKVPMYSTYSTLVLVASSSTDNQNGSLNSNDVTLNQKLVATYSEFIKSNLVIDQVINELNLDMSTKELSRNIKVESFKDTVIIKITVQNPDPETTQKITNAITKVFSKEVVNKFEINNVSIIDTASLPTDVCNNTLVRDMILAFAAGLVGTAGILFVIFYFDDTVKYSESLEEEAGMPVVGKILTSDKKSDLLVEKYPNDLTSEAIRTLRTNLRFSSVDKKNRLIAITSTLPSEGKSFISSNLALSFAQTGKKVLLVDCDLRKGRLHRIFDIVNVSGLSNYLIDDSTEVTKYINKSEYKNLSIVTRGECPPNQSELLNSTKFADLVKTLKDIYDIVIFDGPPCNGLSDALIISTYADDVLVVSKEGKTTKKALTNVKKSLDSVNAHVTGNVLNGINISKYAYGSYYYYSEDGKKKRKH